MEESLYYVNFSLLIMAVSYACSDSLSLAVWNKAGWEQEFFLKAPQ